MTRMQHLSLLIGLLLCGLSYGHDLGVEGDTWPIQEVDIKQLLVSQASKTPWNSVLKPLAEQRDPAHIHFPSTVLPTANRTTTFYYDPSVRLQHDIIVAGQIIYAKGQWVNPLRINQPRTVMLFFDGDSKAQRAFALSALKQYPYDLMLVMTHGDVLALGKAIKRPVYFGYPAILERFYITKVPSLLSVGDGPHHYQFAVTWLTAPYTAKDLERCWHGCPEGAAHAK